MVLPGPLFVVRVVLICLPPFPFFRRRKHPSLKACCEKVHGPGELSVGPSERR